MAKNQRMKEATKNQTELFKKHFFFVFLKKYKVRDMNHKKIKLLLLYQQSVNAVSFAAVGTIYYFHVLQQFHILCIFMSIT